MSKYALERVAPANSMGMRFTTVYGPNARETMLIPRILRNDVPYINTNHSRDFIHVDDLVRAIDNLMKSIFRNVYKLCFPPDICVNGCDDLHHNNEFHIFYPNGPFS